MNFDEDEHVDAIRESIRRFVRQIMAKDLITAWERSGQIPEEIGSGLRELGLHAMAVSEEYGGLGADVPAVLSIVEELARAHCGLASLFIHTACYGGMTIGYLGSREQKARLLPAVCHGNVLFAYGLSEPDAGADLASVATSAKLDGDRIIINGVKRWCTAADIADYIILLARSDEKAPRHQNLTMLLVPADAPGISRTRIETIGHHGLATCDVFFDEVEIPTDSVLGGREMWNRGWSQLVGPALEVEKLEVAALALGTANGAFIEAWEYAQNRKQFGKTISSYQAVRHTLADIKTKLQACRLMLDWAAWLVQTGKPASEATAMAKLFVCDTSCDAVLRCQRILGAYGYATGFQMERFARDALAFPIFGGSSAIQLNNIASYAGLSRG